MAAREEQGRGNVNREISGILAGIALARPGRRVSTAGTLFSGLWNIHDIAEELGARGRALNTILYADAISTTREHMQPTPTCYHRVRQRNFIYVKENNVRFGV